ncbi:ABC transporter substrate-binding protein [Flavobacterium sp. Leaf82]|uniref:ABC transporter substrate-binding protein n=1 Tax=unclassified Flavobacterium TaxID=196869 RepID=UPI0006FE3C6B|nr:ABC transporter substrate-binding protein [Flavobacterium sp. Leaf82]KQO33002.1 ABC transporter substrate-binding protein [Flavobacterium sp. Leaf82]
MKNLLPKLIFILPFFILVGCKKNETAEIATTEIAKNSIEYASGLSIVKHEGYSVVTVSDPWPNANAKFTYILKEKDAKVPDSLQKYTTIKVPLESVVVTSTTNIPFLEMLEVEDKLVGFPHTDYVSSEKTRVLIDKGSVKNVGQNEKLNIEQLIDLSPDLIVTFGVDNNNPMLDNLKKSGLTILIQADWMEQSPLGKAEWIKLYGALFGKEEKAKELFDKIVLSYNQAKKLLADKPATATVLYGAMYEDVWYVAKGNSWVAQFMKDAQANYLWADLKGTGSEGLSFEKVLVKAKTADFWIASGSFKTLEEFGKINTHYSQFDAFKNKNVYTFEGKSGATGGTVYYELAPSRPDLVLKDYIKIFHPDLLPSYEFTFASKLN